MIHYSTKSCQQQATLDICSDLMNSGGYMTYQALDRRHHPDTIAPRYFKALRADGRQDVTALWQDYSVRLVWKLRDEKESQDIDLPEELQPLIYRSRNQLLSLLQKGINLQSWVTSYAQWPSSLALLFQYGHTPTQDYLIRACEAGCKESLNLLVSTGGFFLGPEVLEVAAKQDNPEMLVMVVQELARHRRQLMVLADRYLPDEVISHLGMSSDCLLDIQAYKVYRLLKEEILNIDGLEEEHEWSVYDCIGVDLKLAGLLWNAGFRDMDKEHKDHETCLMVLWSKTPPCSLNTFLMKANWFIAKGADLDHQKPGTSTTALHFLGHGVGRILHLMESASDAVSEMHQLSTESKDLIRKILVDDIYDNCCCACSLAGCSGLTILLSGVFQTWPDKLMEDLLPILGMMLESITPLLEPATQKELAPCVLRFIACQALEIAHTCVHQNFWWKEIPTDEISEIQDEDKELILKLEGLMVEFLWIHVNNVLLSRRPLDEEEISKILDTGVVLYNRDDE
ncbi:uncharacterized protein BDV17DRAFT_298849 [Aspergillus undulatus]|uniref:uncharacterized protein n=1 Tax=Aspergillus undulatus TaxID=1810928 RepID=UPI003CCE43D3